MLKFRVFFIILGNGKGIWNERAFWILSLHLINWNFLYQCRLPCEHTCFLNESKPAFQQLNLVRLTSQLKESWCDFYNRPSLNETWWWGLLPSRHTKIIFVRGFWTNSHLLHAAVTDCRARKGRCTRRVSGVPPGDGLHFMLADREPVPSALCRLKDPSKLG